jgi:hypothetical protein
MTHARRAYLATLSAAAMTLTVALGLAPSTGCQVNNGGGGPGGQNAGGGGTCVQDDLACDFDSDCCSGFCALDGFCGEPDNCVQDDLACDVDTDCCSGLCALDGFCGEPGDCVGTPELYVCPARVSGEHEVGVTSCPQALGTVTVHNGTDAAVDVDCTPGFYLLCTLSSPTIPAQGEISAEIEFGCSTTSTFEEVVTLSVQGGGASVDVLGTVLFDAACGDGFCDFNGSEPSTCPEDCCGDGFCDPGEDAVCPTDCG